MREPGDFVVTPNPVELAFRIRLARMLAHTVIVEFHEIRQMLARPAAESFSAFALVVNAIGKAQFQDRLLRLVWRLHDAQGKRIEIQKWISLPLEAASGNMAIQQHHVAAGAFGRVRANQLEQVLPMSIVTVVMVDVFNLSEMNSLDADVNVGCGLIIEPELGF